MKLKRVLHLIDVSRRIDFELKETALLETLDELVPGFTDAYHQKVEERLSAAEDDSAAFIESVMP